MGAQGSGFATTGLHEAGHEVDRDIARSVESRTDGDPHHSRVAGIGGQNCVEHVLTGADVPGKPEHEDLRGRPLAAGNRRPNFDHVRGRESPPFRDNRLEIQTPEDVGNLIFMPGKPAGRIRLQRRATGLRCQPHFNLENRQREPVGEGDPLHERPDVTGRARQPAPALNRLSPTLDHVGDHPRVLGPLVDILPRLTDGRCRPRGSHREPLGDAIAAVSGEPQRHQPA